jgi:hypothetical protein
MWTLTEDQFAFLKTRFKDPLLWIEDCEKWIGHILVGNKAHYCYEWDGLPVDETTREFECCLCWKEPSNGKADH